MVLDRIIKTCLLQGQTVEFPWSDVKQWECDEEGMSFAFQYQKPAKNPRWVKIFTPYVSHLWILEIQLWADCDFCLLQYIFMQDCFDRILEESKWSQEWPSTNN